MSWRVRTTFSLFAWLIAACSAVDIATQPDRPDGGPVCEDVRMVGGNRILTCAEAVQSAEAKLGWLHAPVSAASFDLGKAGTDAAVICAPDEELCMAVLREGMREGEVRFEFWFGDPISVRVRLDGNDIARAAEPVPVSD